ncbi:MAG: hypothetical protein PUC18_12640 [Prevotellaceae bacterium]|nr:hypothetical protein [Prevotellaceae bacterium]
MACKLNHVLKGANECKENPAGLSNYCMIVPIDDDHIESIEVNQTKNQYDIVAKGSTQQTPKALQGWRVDFKNQTGQVTSEDNGAGKGWTGTGTGRVEIGEDAMSTLSRNLSNLDGNFLAFFPTGNKVEGKTEWKVIGNPEGDGQFSTAADSGAARGDDHGTTFTITCDYMLYDVVKFYGEIEQEEES